MNCMHIAVFWNNGSFEDRLTGVISLVFYSLVVAGAYGSQDSEPNLHVHSGLKYEKPSNIGFADRKTLMRRLGGGGTSLGESWLNPKGKLEVNPPSGPSPIENPKVLSHEKSSSFQGVLD